MLLSLLRCKVSTVKCQMQLLFASRVLCNFEFNVNIMSRLRYNCGTSWRQQLYLIILDQFCDTTSTSRQYWKSCFSFSIFYSFLEFCITVHLTVTAVQWFVIYFIFVSLNDKLPIIVNYSFILLLLPNLLPSCPIHVAHVVCHPNCLLPIHLSLNWCATQTSVHPGVASQEFQLSLTNCVTHLCKCNTVALLTKCPSPYVLPCRIWSFCINGCRHKYTRTSKIGEYWNVWSLGMGGMAAPKIHAPPHMSYVLPRQIW